MNIDNQIKQWAKLILMESEETSLESTDVNINKLLDDVSDHFKLESEVEVQLNDDGDSIDVMFDRSGYDNSSYANQEFENVENSVKFFIENYNKMNKASLDYSLDDTDDVITIYQTEGKNFQNINEVSDVDVDWSDEELNRSDYENLQEFTQSQINLSEEDKDWIIESVVFYLNYITKKDFRDYVETGSLKGSELLRDINRKFQKWSHGEHVSDIIKTAREEN